MSDWEGLFAKVIPSGTRTTCWATDLAASRYLRTSEGDMTKAAPVFEKPSPAALSAGNSLAGWISGRLVRSRMVLVYSALLSRLRRTGPGSPA